VSITAGLPELLAYSDHERAKWRAWLEADPSRLSLPVQDGGRFPTIGILLDQFTVDGVTCQVGQIAISDVEHDIRKVVVDLDPDAFTMKALGGLHDGLPLAGDDLIAGWRAAAAYSDDLQRTIVARHWKVVPLWKLAAHVAARDAELWRHQILVDGAYDLLAVLAATNRVWFSSFQFKRTRTLTDRLEVAPPDLADRLEALFTLPPEESARELERLTDETRAILEERLLLS